MTATRPLVSVLIPVWNREQTVARAIQSVTGSDYDNIEIIVSDNGSTDRTALLVEEMAKEDSRITLLKSESNYGPIANWSKCLSRVKGEYVKIVWSDDAIQSNTISRLLQPMLDDESVAFTFCKAKLLSDCHQGSERLLYDMPSATDIGMIEFITGFSLKVPHLPVSPGCAMLRTKYTESGWALVDDFVPQCKDNAIGPDVLLFYGALLHGGSGRYVADTSVIFYSGDTSITEQSGRSLLNSCYDSSVLHLLEHYQHGRYIKPFLLLRLFRSMVDNNKARSVMADELKKQSFRSLFSVGLVHALWLLSFAISSRLARLFK